MVGEKNENNIMSDSISEVKQSKKLSITIGSNHSFHESQCITRSQVYSVRISSMTN